jgi:hypothetical protein
VTHHQLPVTKHKFYFLFIYFVEVYFMKFIKTLSISLYICISIYTYVVINYIEYGLGVLMKLSS